MTQTPTTTAPADTTTGFVPGPLDRTAPFYVAGHRGLVGSAIWRHLQDEGFENLIGDPAKAKDKLGWEATVKAPELARLMVDADIALLENDAWIDTVDLASWAK